MHLLRAVIQASQALCHLILLTTLRGKYYYPCFYRQETEALKDAVTCPRQHTIHSFLHSFIMYLPHMWLQPRHQRGSHRAARLGPKPQHLDSRLHAPGGRPAPTGNTGFAEPGRLTEETPGKPRPQPISRCPGSSSYRKEGTLEGGQWTVFLETGPPSSELASSWKPRQRLRRAEPSDRSENTLHARAGSAGPPEYLTGGSPSADCGDR